MKIRRTRQFMTLTDAMNKKLSMLMLLSNLICTLFYSISYPYIYAETIKAVPHLYIGLEQIFACLGTIIFCKLWNTYSDKLFEHYRLFLIIEVIADTILFADVLIRGDLKFYFLLNIIIYSIITKNLSCGGIKMRAMVNPSEKERELYDNNSNIVDAIATLCGASAAIFFHFDLQLLFIFALVGNSMDNIFYLYIYHKIKTR